MVNDRYVHACLVFHYLAHPPFPHVAVSSSLVRVFVVVDHVRAAENGPIEKVDCAVVGSGIRYVPRRLLVLACSYCIVAAYFSRPHVVNTHTGIEADTCGTYVLVDFCAQIKKSNVISCFLFVLTFFFSFVAFGHLLLPAVPLHTHPYRRIGMM